MPGPDAETPGAFKPRACRDEILGTRLAATATTPLSVTWVRSLIVDRCVAFGALRFPIFP